TRSWRGRPPAGAVAPRARIFRKTEGCFIRGSPVGERGRTLGRLKHPGACPAATAGGVGGGGRFGCGWGRGGGGARPGWRRAWGAGSGAGAPDGGPAPGGQGCVRGKDGGGLDEEGAERLLEGGDGTGRVGEGGLEMGEDLCGRPVGGSGGQWGGQLGWRAAGR